MLIWMEPASSISFKMLKIHSGKCYLRPTDILYYKNKSWQKKRKIKHMFVMSSCQKNNISSVTKSFVYPSSQQSFLSKSWKYHVQVTDVSLWNETGDNTNNNNSGNDAQKYVCVCCCCCLIYTLQRNTRKKKAHGRYDNNKSSDTLNKITACVNARFREWILHDMMWRQKHHQHINSPVKTSLSIWTH